MTLKSEKPVFVQIIEMIEDDILSGIYDVDDLIISHHKYPSYCPSTLQRRNEPSVCLQTGGLFIKKRGVGMAVTKEAMGMIMSERKKAFF